MSGQIPRDALIHDLAIVLSGALRESAKTGTGPHLAARRMQDVLGIMDGEPVRAVEARLRGVLAPEDESAAPVSEERACIGGICPVPAACDDAGVCRMSPEYGRRYRREQLEYTERNRGLMSPVAQAELAVMRAEDGDKGEQR
jgi:hypothetical protein